MNELVTATPRYLLAPETKIFKSIIEISKLTLMYISIYFKLNMVNLSKYVKHLILDLRVFVGLKTL